VLEVRAPGHTHRLLVSCHPDVARLHLVTQPIQNPQTPPAFCQYLRAHVQGARIDAVTPVPNDRIVHLHLTTKEGPGIVVAELTGKRANLLVLDKQHNVLQDLNRSKERVGQAYVPPQASPHESSRPYEPRFTPVANSPFPLSAAIEAFYNLQEATMEAGALQQARASQLRKTIKKLHRRIEAWEKDLVKAERYRSYARYGELLKANLGTLKKGQTSASVIDYFDDALPQVTIPLDPIRSPQGNMDDYFRKHRKHESAQRELLPRIAEAERDLAALRQELTSIEQGTWQPPAPSSPTKTRRKQHRRISSAASPREGSRGPFRRFVSTDGLPIFVGKNARENDELTFGLAKSDDLWLHARGTPGSHVVVRLEKGTDAPPETLKDAATLALLYSDLKKSGKGEVIYTRRKWVKKAKGQASGAVTVTQEHSVYVSLDKTRLAALKTRSEPDT
jgi:predicted ribosome quality control (RQC) complex YloA/Tae2 family protein